MDVNEKIAEAYIRYVKKWFYIPDIVFKVERNYSNIDLFAYDPKTNIFYDIEVKFRSAFKANYKSVEYIKEQFVRSQRKEILQKIVGNNIENINLRRLLITTKHYFGSTEENIEKKKKEFSDKINNIEFKFFEDIVLELHNKIGEDGLYSNEITQFIRMLKKYKFS